MPDRQQPSIVLFIIPLIIGLVGFSRVTESPQFESYRTMDVVQLLGSGVCFGVALTSLMIVLLRPRT